MNEKVLWKIESLVEQEATHHPPQKNKGLAEKWFTHTGFFNYVEVFEPVLSREVRMSDRDGEYHGLQHDVVLLRGPAPGNNQKTQEMPGAGTPTYIFDNHHKSLFAFLESKQNYERSLSVVHIDAHPDDALPQFEPPQIELENIHEVYKKSRICDFLEVAQQGGLIHHTQRVVTSKEFAEFLPPTEPFILSLDIDIFGPEGSYIELEKKVQAIVRAWQHAEVITIATSPGFIDQDFGWEIIKIFLKYLP